MHEYNITQSILDIVLDHVKKEKNSQVEKIYITIGKLTSFVPDSIDYYFAFLSKGTKAAGAKLKFDIKNIKYVCNDCKHEFETEYFAYICPSCDSTNIKNTAGNEFFVESIEVINEEN